MSTPIMSRSEAAQHDAHRSSVTTVFFDRQPLPAHLLAFRTEPNGKDVFGQPGEEFGADVSAQMAARWERVAAEFQECLAEQEAVYAQIQARRQPLIDARHAEQEARRAQVQAEEQEALTSRFGLPAWVLLYSWNEGRRGQTGIRRISVHRPNCRYTRRYPDWRLTPERLDKVVQNVHYHGDVDRSTKSKVHFCAHCTEPEKVREIREGLAFGRRAGLDWDEVAEMLVRGPDEQFEAQVTLLALRGEQVSWRPSGSFSPFPSNPTASA